MKFATKLMQHYHLILSMLLHNLEKLKNQIFCKYLADMEKCKQIAFYRF